jgi:sugar lactone lactonase YvrE
MLHLIPLLVLVAQGAPGDLLVTSRNTDEVLRYDTDTGSFLGVFASGGGLDNPVGLTFGPDGHLYVSSADANEVLRYDGVSGAFIDVFASGGTLGSPRQLNFGPDGQLYVASASNNRILRFDGTSGAPLGVAASGGSLLGPTSFTIGPDKDFFVVSVINSRVKRYDWSTGAFEGNFVRTNVNGPHDVGFGPDGRFYVTDARTTRINVFDPATGAFIETFVSDPALSSPLGMSWDGRGRFYVSNQGTDEVRRYDAVTGEFLGSLFLAGAGGLNSPLFHTFLPDRSGLHVLPLWPGYAGETNTLQISGARPGSRLLLLSGPGTVTTVSLGGCPAPLTLLTPARVLATRLADESGRAHFSGMLPASMARRPLYLQALVPSTCEAGPVAVTQVERKTRRADAP